MEPEISEWDVQRWGAGLDRVGERLAPRFGRAEVPRRAPLDVRGLIARVDRKYGWQLATTLVMRRPRICSRPFINTDCSFAVECG